MGLAYRGAKGATAAELAKVLHYGLPPQDYLRANGPLLESMNFAAGGRELRTANAIWLQKGAQLVPDYAADVARHAKAGIKEVDYCVAPQAARGEINAWVSEATRDKIAELLGPGDVGSDTRSILVNAIYWKAAWQNAFEQQATKVEPFTLLDGSRKPTPLMNMGGGFQVVERGGIQAINLPYVGGEVTMSVFLPRSVKGLPRFESKLTAVELDRWFSELDSAAGSSTVLTLPKIHLEARADLYDALAAMGVRTAFSLSADFSGIVRGSDPCEPGPLGIEIGKVIHQTFLDVDEKGTEAAAATAVVTIMITAARRGPWALPITFRADRPFFFVLRDRRSGLILFMGRYVAPPES